MDAISFMPLQNPQRNSPSMKPRLSIVLPIFNESKNLEPTLKEVTSVLEGLQNPYEIIVVDDGSSDGSWGKIEKLAQTYQGIKAIRFTRNFGKEAAILAGLQSSSGDAAIIMDADLQHPPALISEMVKIWEDEGVDVVHAVKSERENEPLMRRFFTKCFYKAMKRFSGLELEGTTDFKLLDRTVVDQYVRLPERIRFFRGVVTWLGHRHAHVSFKPGIRRNGKSRWSILSLFRLGFRALFAFSALPLQIITVLGIITFLASIFLGIETVIKKFTGGAAEGFPTVIILLLFIGSTLMISLGLIGQYIAMIYDEVKQRPPFVIEKTIE